MYSFASFVLCVTNNLIFDTILNNTTFIYHSDEANNACSTVTIEEWKRPRSESTGADTDSVYVSGSVYTDHSGRRQKQVKSII